MQFKQILLLVLLCAITLSSCAQRSGSIRRVVQTQAGTPIPAITIKFLSTNRATSSGQAISTRYLSRQQSLAA